MTGKNYSESTKSTFELLSSYFARIFYEYLYEESKKYAIKRENTSLTREYINALNAYADGVTNIEDVHYKNTIQDIISFYAKYTKYNSISIDGFTNMIIAEFVPKEHFLVLSDNEKWFFLHKILTNVLKNYVKSATEGYLLEMVIDNHEDEETGALCKSEIIDLLCEERELIYNRFVKKEIKMQKDTTQNKSQNRKKNEYAELNIQSDKNPRAKQLEEYITALSQDRDILVTKCKEILEEKCRLDVVNKQLREALIAWLQTNKQEEISNFVINDNFNDNNKELELNKSKLCAIDHDLDNAKIRIAELEDGKRRADFKINELELENVRLSENLRLCEKRILEQKVIINELSVENDNDSLSSHKDELNESEVISESE